MFVTESVEVSIHAEPGAIWDFAADPQNWTASNPEEHEGLRYFSADARPATGVEFHQKERVAGIYADLRGRVHLADRPRLLVWTGIASYRLSHLAPRVRIPEGGVLRLEPEGESIRMSHEMFMQFPETPFGRALLWIFERRLDGRDALRRHGLRELLYFKEKLEH